MNLRSRMTLKSSVVTFLTLQPHWPQQPRQPHWPQQPLQPYFLKELLIQMVWSSMASKWPIPVLFFGMDHQKIQIFTDVWYLFCWRLLRPIYATFLRTGWWNSNSLTSGIYKYLQAISNLHFSICQSHFKRNISIWNTLYLTNNSFKVKVKNPNLKRLFR